MLYADAYQLIEDGDLIAVHGRTGLLAPITRLVCRSPVTHTGIAFWWGGLLWMSELNGGHNHPILMDQLAGCDFDVRYPPVDDRAAIRAAVLKNLRTRVDYSLAALVVIGLLDMLRLPLFVHWRRELVCSGYCTRDYEGAGWTEHSRIVSPRALAALCRMKLEVRAGLPAKSDVNGVLHA